MAQSSRLLPRSPRHQQGHWIINGGATSGIPAPSGSDAARLALYPFDAPAALLCDPAKAVAMARVEDVLPATSRLAIENKVALDPKATYKAIIVSLPAPPLHVLLDGDAASCTLVRQALKTASPEGKPSLFIAEAAKKDAPDFRLIARDGQFVITRPGEDRPLVAQIDGLNEDGAKRAVERLEHMARWTQTARLSNPASSILPGDVKLTVLVEGKEVSGREIRLEYQFKNGKQVEPTFQVSMTNNSAQALLRAARPDPALPGARGIDQVRICQAGAWRDGLGEPWPADLGERTRRDLETRGD